MEVKELLGQELVEMHQAHKDAKERLAQLQAEVEQLAGAIAFAEYILEKLTADEPAEEVRDDSSS